MEDENRNENIDLEETDLNTMVGENIASMYEALQDLKVGSEEWCNVQKELRAWYESYSDVQIKSAKVVSEDTQRSRDRASTEEIEKARLRAKGAEIGGQFLTGVACELIKLGGGMALGKMFQDQQNRILAAEYCDDKFVLNKSFQSDMDALRSMVLKKNG